MSYRTFLDSSGKRWEVWLVTPAVRRVERPADARPQQPPVAAAELDVPELPEEVVAYSSPTWRRIETESE